VICPKCHGSGKTTCTICFGDRTVQCYECQGTNWVEEYPDDMTSVEVPCPECVNSYEDCLNCDRNGEQFCPTCKGIGEVNPFRLELTDIHQVPLLIIVENYRCKEAV
jgi:hypothetical protein